MPPEIFGAQAYTWYEEVSGISIYFVNDMGLIVSRVGVQEGFLPFPLAGELCVHCERFPAHT